MPVEHPPTPGLTPRRSPSRLGTTRPRPVRLPPFPKGRARSAHAWPRSSSPGVRPPTGRPCISGPSHASHSSIKRTSNSTPGSASSNSSLGRKAETPATVDGPDRPTRSPRPRGQRRGKPGPKRRDYSHLPAVEQVVELPAEQQRCAGCGAPFVAFPGTDNTTILEVEVRAHRRVYRRRRCRPSCSCGTHPGIVTAPPPAKVIPKSILGISVWVTVLLEKFVLPPDLPAAGGPEHPGAEPVAGHADRGPATAVAPVRAGVRLPGRAQPAATQWHADEPAGWSLSPRRARSVTAGISRVFHGADVVVFVLSPSRRVGARGSSGAGRGGHPDRGPVRGLPACPGQGRTILLAVCPAHVRRDFLTVARSWPDQEAWALGWVERIGVLYACNKRRSEAPGTTPLFAARHRKSGPPILIWKTRGSAIDMLNRPFPDPA